MHACGLFSSFGRWLELLNWVQIHENGKTLLVTMIRLAWTGLNYYVDRNTMVECMVEGQDKLSAPKLPCFLYGFPLFSVVFFHEEEKIYV
ncbi:hypothetical protein GQ457_14G010250 [Hibiscus cannabinus]